MIIKYNKPTKVTLLVLVLEIVLIFVGFKFMDYHTGKKVNTTPAAAGEALWLAYAVPFFTISFLVIISTYLISKNINKRTAILIISLSILLSAFSLTICCIAI